MTKIKIFISLLIVSIFSTYCFDANNAALLLLNGGLGESKTSTKPTNPFSNVVSDEINVSNAFGGSNGIKDQVIFYADKPGVRKSVLGSLVQEKSWNKLEGTTLQIPKGVEVTFGVDTSLDGTKNTNDIIKFGTYKSSTDEQIIFDGTTTEKTFGLNSVRKINNSSNHGILRIASIVKGSKKKTPEQRKEILDKLKKASRSILAAKSREEAIAAAEEFRKTISSLTKEEFLKLFPFPNGTGALGGAGWANGDADILPGRYMKPEVTVMPLPPLSPISVNLRPGAMIMLRYAQFKDFDASDFSSKYNLVGISRYRPMPIIGGVFTKADNGISIYAKKASKTRLKILFVPGTDATHSAEAVAKATLSVWVKQAAVKTLSKDGRSYGNATESIFTYNNRYEPNTSKSIIVNIGTEPIKHEVRIRPVSSTYTKVWDSNTNR